MSDMSPKHISKCIRKAMIDKDIKAQDLATELGVHANQVSKYRAGNCDSVKTLTRIAEICDMTFAEMMDLA